MKVSTAIALPRQRASYSAGSQFKTKKKMPLIAHTDINYLLLNSVLRKLWPSRVISHMPGKAFRVIHIAIQFFRRARVSKV